MARPISDEELQLKRRARRRLIGAIVLVTAIVVVLPMVLDTEPKPIERRSQHQDSVSRFGRVHLPHGAGSAIRRSPAPEPAAKRPRRTTKSTPKVAAAPEARSCGAEPAPRLPRRGANAGPAKRPKPAAATEAPAKTRARSRRAAASEPAAPALTWCRSSRSPTRRRRSRSQEQMAAAGLKSYTEVVKTAKGDVTRVRAGPFADARRGGEGARPAEDARAHRQHRR